MNFQVLSFIYASKKYQVLPNILSINIAVEYTRSEIDWADF